MIFYEPLQLLDFIVIFYKNLFNFLDVGLEWGRQQSEALPGEAICIVGPYLNHNF